MVNWWFGARWFGFRLDPRKWKGWLLRVPNHRAPNTNLPIVEKSRFLGNTYRWFSCFQKSEGTTRSTAKGLFYGEWTKPHHGFTVLFGKKELKIFNLLRFAQGGCKRKHHIPQIVVWWCFTLVENNKHHLKQTNVFNFWYLKENSLTHPSHWPTTLWFGRFWGSLAPQLVGR